MQKQNTLVDWLSLSLLLALVTGGLSLRTQSASPTQGIYKHGSAEKHLIEFLRFHGFTNIKSISFTEDAGVKGLQVSIPTCNGYLVMLVMPDGDEFSGLWKTLALHNQYTTRYLFDGTLYTEFPRTLFWFTTMLHALAIKIGLQSVFYPGPALAIAHPEHCKDINQIFFNKIMLKRRL
ncbi:hypothetical protein [Candidatus Enterovibrio altilux]|uniref:hypothetical protein n=1 Tax=Candidatus Enterovibrio altilux TaxID=1927128 RepID=UPI001237D9BF|nr:hypothetical protein [Candidatus Enterovibrio luxaltus]